MRRLRDWWWVPLLYTLAVIWIYRDLWHQHGAATGLGWDTIDTHGPDLDFFSSEIREGRFSLWNPYDKGGYPVFCDPVFDRYYPFNWPFGLWGAVFGTSWWLVQIKVLAHHVMAGILMHAFLRSRKLSVRAAMVGGLGLVACAPLLTHKASNILWPLVWVPLVWMAIDFALEKPSWRRGVAIAAALWPCMTAGSPPGLFYAALAILPYATWRLVGALRTKPNYKQLAICIGAAIGVALLITAVTVLPTGDLVALGSRDRFAPPGRAFALALSLPLPAELRGVGVRGAGLFELYMGAAVVLLSLCALVVRPKHDRGGAIALAITAALGLWLASGSTGGLLPRLVDHIPVFGMLRVPGRYKLLAAWALAASAGYGVDALEPKHWRRIAIVLGVGVVATVVLVLGWGHPASANERPAWWSIAATLVAAGFIAAAVWGPKRFAGAAVSALALCALLDAPLFTFVLPGAPPASDRRQTHEHDAEVLARLDGVRDHWRVYDEFVLGERAGARLRIRDFRGYPALDPISLRRYVDVLDFAKRDAGILEDFNVRYILKRPHFRYGNSTAFPSLPHAEYESRGDNLWEAKHPAPLVVWYGAVSVEPQKNVLSAMRAVLEPDGTRRRAIVEPGDLAESSGEPGFAEGELKSYAPDEIAFSIDAPRDGLVVLNEIMFPGWQVTVDGRTAKPVRANYLMRGVWVPAGQHAIVWRFEPRHWRALVGCYLLTLAIMIAAGVAALRRSRHAKTDV